jgi:hypothetical protein
MDLIIAIKESLTTQLVKLALFFSDGNTSEKTEHLI